MQEKTDIQTEEDIHKLVHTFYEKVNADDPSIYSFPILKTRPNPSAERNSAAR